jgi:hypothetical protein
VEFKRGDLIAASCESCKLNNIDKKRKEIGHSVFRRRRVFKARTSSE